jgi:hypothetical protein
MWLWAIVGLDPATNMSEYAQLTGSRLFSCTSIVSSCTLILLESP